MKRNLHAQQIIEYLLLFIGVIAVLLVFARPGGLLPNKVNEALNRTLNLDTGQKYIWQAESVTCPVCGVAVVLTRDVYCISKGAMFDSSSKDIVVNDSYCDPATKPSETIACPAIPCGACNWSAWNCGACSAPCNGGTQICTRTCDCVGPVLSVDCGPGDTSKTQTCNSMTCCGNGVIDGGLGEACDATAMSPFGGKTCADYGFTSGSLSCVNNCTDIDESACYSDICDPWTDLGCNVDPPCSNYGDRLQERTCIRITPAGSQPPFTQQQCVPDSDCVFYCTGNKDLCATWCPGETTQPPANTQITHVHSADCSPSPPAYCQARCPAALIANTTGTACECRDLPFPSEQVGCTCECPDGWTFVSPLCVKDEGKCLGDKDVCADWCCGDSSTPDDDTNTIHVNPDACGACPQDCVAECQAPLEATAAGCDCPAAAPSYVEKTDCTTCEGCSGWADKGCNAGTCAWGERWEQRECTEITAAGTNTWTEDQCITDSDCQTSCTGSIDACADWCCADSSTPPAPTGVIHVNPGACGACAHDCKAECPSPLEATAAGCECPGTAPSYVTQTDCTTCEGCEDWTDQGCGDGGCGWGERLQERDCMKITSAGTNTTTETQCVADASCEFQCQDKDSCASWCCADSSEPPSDMSTVHVDEGACTCAHDCKAECPSPLKGAGANCACPAAPKPSVKNGCTCECPGGTQEVNGNCCTPGGSLYRRHIACGLTELSLTGGTLYGYRSNGDPVYQGPGGYSANPTCFTEICHTTVIYGVTYNFHKSCFNACVLNAFGLDPFECNNTFFDTMCVF